MTRPSRLFSLVMASVVLVTGSGLRQYDLQQTGRAIGSISTSTSIQSGAYEHTQIRWSSSLWADGHGDTRVEDTIRNISIWNFTSYSWCFTWDEGQYWNISVRDDNGPLLYTTSYNGPQMCVQFFFRHVLPQGFSYHFTINVAIAGMATCTGDVCYASWGIQSDANTRTLIEDVIIPSNSTLNHINPIPNSQHANHFEWVLTDWQTILNVSVDYTLRSTMNIQPLLQGSIPVDGKDPVWETDQYDKSNTNIYGLGCFLTSQAMIVNYYGQNGLSGFTTDPRKLNTWLNDHSGYDGADVRSSQVAVYATKNGVPLYWVGNIWHRDDAMLDNYLRTGFPVILGVPGHYVLATGKVNGVYQINDPLKGATTLADYGNTYSSMTLMSNEDGDHRHLRVSGHSPIELVATDPMGRRVGYDPNSGISYGEIPDAQYYTSTLTADDGTGISFADKVIDIPMPLEGTYQVQVIGTGSGPYTVDYEHVDMNGNPNVSSFSGTAALGSVETRNLTYTSTYFPVFLPILRR